MKFRSEGMCADSQPDEVGKIGAQEGVYAMYCVHKDLEDLDFLPRSIVEEAELCSDCDETTKALKSRMVGGSQCQGHPDRIHVTVWLYFDPANILLIQILRCIRSLSDEERAWLIARTKYECLTSGTWTEEGPYLDGLENVQDDMLDEFKKMEEDINVEDLLTEIAMMLSDNEPQD